MIADAHGLRYPPRGLEFDAMPLAVIEAEGMAVVTFAFGNGQRGGGVQSAGYQDDGFHVWVVIVIGGQ